MEGANAEVRDNERTQVSAPASHEPVQFDDRVSQEVRRQMIAQAAYFIAERNGFDGTHQLSDWLAAEAEVNASLRR